jgi:CHASE3 domain sensor protein
MYPREDEDDIASSDEFDSRVFQLWANVNRSLLGLEEALPCLREDIAAAIRQRVELPDFAAEFDAWMYKANEELRARADEDRKRVDIDDTISNAVQSGAASSIIFLLVAAALLAPLVSMCTQE